MSSNVMDDFPSDIGGASFVGRKLLWDPFACPDTADEVLAVDEDIEKEVEAVQCRAVDAICGTEKDVPNERNANTAQILVADITPRCLWCFGFKAPPEMLYTITAVLLVRTDRQ